MALHRPRTTLDRVAGQGVRIGLLNGFEVKSDLGRVDVPAVGARLIAYLALQERPVRRCALAGTLWPETTQEKAQASLRSTLWRIRRVDERIVRSTHECIALHDAVDVDSKAVLERTHGICEGNLRLDERTLISSLSSELLPDWYDDWVVFERERFRLMALRQALERIASSLTARGNVDDAVEYTLAAVRLEPLRESAHRALISAHIAQGNTGEALRQYRLYDELVRAELGIGPSTHMSDLLTRVGLGEQALSLR